MSSKSSTDHSRSATTSILARALTIASSMFEAGFGLMRDWLDAKPSAVCGDGLSLITGDSGEFAAVTASLNMEAIPEYVSTIRRSTVLPQRNEVTPWSFDCIVEAPPLSGSYNILFPINFGDTVKWLLKVPADGHSEAWNEAAARNLETEVLTMRYLKKKGLPVAEVYAFNTSLSNPLKCPFILMEYLRGWAEDQKTEEAREVFRQQCLRSLASIMIKLNTSTSLRQAGSPQYDQIGNPVSVGSFRIPNPVSYHEFYMTQTAHSSTAGHYEDFCEIEPSNDERSYLLSVLDRHTPGRYQLEVGADRALRLLIDWATTKGTESNHESVLTHPDLDLQNILVDESGIITGLIDWDGVTMIPRSMGCSFPKWISRNWDPDCYRWRRDYASNASCQIDHSPEKMEYYRSMYVQCMEDVLLEAGTSEQRFTDYSDILRQSILFEALRRAVIRPESSYFIVRKICNLIGHLTSQASFKSTYPIWKEPAQELVTNTDSADLSKDSDSTRVVSITDDSASTTYSDSDNSSDDSKASYSTCPTSECASIQGSYLIESGTTAVLQGTKGLDAVHLPKLVSIEEASRENKIIVAEATDVHRSLTPESDGSGSEKLPGQKKSSTSPRNPRAVFKQVRSACSKKMKKSLKRLSDSSRLSSVGTDVTVSKAGDKDASSSAVMKTNQSNNSVQATMIKDRSIGSAAEHSSMDETDADATAGDVHNTDESKQIGCGPDHSGNLGIEISEACRPLEEDILNTDQNAESISKTSQEASSVPSESDGSLGSEDPLIRRKDKTGLTRRVLNKLADVKKDHLRNTVSSKIRGIERWVKDPLHRYHHDSSTSSASNKASTSPKYTPDSPVASIPPHISKISSISGLGDPFRTSENEITPSSEVLTKFKRVPPGQYRITSSGAKAWDLQNLEPLDEELLEKEQFMTHQIFKALAEDTLDEVRMQRLKAGFSALFDSL